MPSTRPRASSSGPPELPWLIAASVWIAPTVAKPVSDSIERSSAEMTPTDSDCSSPNGLPIAATGAPTTRSPAEPSGSGRRVRPVGSTFSSATSANGSKPTIFAGTWLPSWKRTKTCVGLADRRALAARDDVGVRGDLAVAGDHEARAEAGLPAAAAARVAEAGADDRHDAGRLALVDRRRVERRPPGAASPRVLDDLDARRALRLGARRVCRRPPAAAAAPTSSATSGQRRPRGRRRLTRAAPA